MVRFFNPGLEYQNLKSEIDAEINRIFSAGDLILRDDIEKFEKNLAEYIGTKYAVALNSGTDALYLALKVMDIGPGDEVLVPSHTFVATAQVVNQLGAEIVLMDLDGKFKITEKTRAIMPCHIAGEFGGDMELIIKIANMLGLIVIEDACQALGAEQYGKKAGSWGDIGCFSFYPAKILGAYGDAGAITTNSESVYNEVKELRNHYKKDYSQWGINSRMDNIQATILNVKFKYLQDYLDKRKTIAILYNDGLMNLPIELPKNTSGRVWQDYVIRVEKRNELYEFLKKNGIETMKNEYPFPISKLPQSIQYEKETLRLPCNPYLTLEEINLIIDKIREFYGL